MSHYNILSSVSSFLSLISTSAITISTASAVTMIDLSPNQWYEDNSGAYLWQYDTNGGGLLSGANAGVFLELTTDSNASGNQDSSAGWNYGAAAAPDDDTVAIETYLFSESAYDEHIKDQEAVKLSEASTLQDYQGNNYYLFLLNINETGASPTQDLTTIEVYLTDASGSGNFSASDLDAATAHFTLDCGYTMTDSGGQSRWDAILAVPEADLGTDTTKYVHVFVEYQDDHGGPDQIGFDSANYGNLDTTIPEPSSSLLCSLGTVIMLLRRRRN